MSCKMIHAWEAARVVRKHTMINIRAENIAEHTWGVVHLLLSVWVNVPLRVVKAAQYHDSGEFATGDIPAHIKWANDDMRELTDRLAGEGTRQCLPEHLHECLEISEVEAAIIEICDRAEFCFSTYYERMMGNRHVVKMFYRSQDKIKKLIWKYGEQIVEISEDLGERILRLDGELKELGDKMGEAI